LVGMMHTHVAGILYIYNIVAMCLWWYAAWSMLWCWYHPKLETWSMLWCWYHLELEAWNMLCELSWTLKCPWSIKLLEWMSKCELWKWIWNIQYYYSQQCRSLCRV
jgi:hypothetical protein